MLRLFDLFLEKNKEKNKVIADVRLVHEINYLKKLNFNIIKIYRTNSLIDTHISENQNYLYYDFYIENIVSKQDLFNKYKNFIYIPF